MKYDKSIEDVARLTITSDNKATMVMDEVVPATVQLANDEEAVKLIAEFEDNEGELCHAEDSIMGKYPEFHPFRP